MTTFEPILTAEGPSTSIEDYVSNFEESDIRTIIARIVESTEPDEIFEFWDLSNIRNIRFEIMVDRSGDKSMWQDVFNYETQDGDPIFVGRYPKNITIDQDVIEFVTTFRDIIERKLPVLVEIVSTIQEYEDEIKIFMENNSLFSISGNDFISLLVIAPEELADSDKSKEWHETMEQSDGLFPYQLSVLLGRMVRISDIDALWPDHLKEKLQSSLSLQDRVDLLCLLNAGARSAIEHIPGAGIRPMVILSNVAGYHELKLSNDTSKILLNNPELVSESVLLKVIGRPDLTIPANYREAILISTLREADRHEYLRKQGISQCTVIESYRNYESCEATEGRLVSELREGDALLLRLEFERTDGEPNTSVLFAIKYEEVTLAAVIDSTDPRFIEGMSYLPVGATRDHLEVMHGSEGVRYEEVVIPEKMRPLIFAKNRTLRFGSAETWERVKEMALRREQELQGYE